MTTNEVETMDPQPATSDVDTLFGVPSDAFTRDMMQPSPIVEAGAIEQLTAEIEAAGRQAVEAAAHTLAAHVDVITLRSAGVKLRHAYITAEADRQRVKRNDRLSDKGRGEALVKVDETLAATIRTIEENVIGEIGQRILKNNKADALYPLDANMAADIALTVQTFPILQPAAVIDAATVALQTARHADTGNARWKANHELQRAYLPQLKAYVNTPKHPQARAAEKAVHAIERHMHIALNGVRAAVARDLVTEAQTSFRFVKNVAGRRQQWDDLVASTAGTGLDW